MQKAWWTALIALLTSTVALAHHPFDAEFDWKQPVTITGTVVELDWKNPHATMDLKGNSDKGAEAEWHVELGSPAELILAGWTKHQLQLGDRVSVDGWLAKDGGNRVSAKSVTVGATELFAAGAFFERALQLARAEGRRSTTPSDQSSSTASGQK
ncbi:MAG: DUF6152 family protein [Vicinamibacterales bacterium]